MNKTQLESIYISGVWRISQKIPFDELIDAAKELAKDDRYVEVYIRGASKDQDGISIVYKANPDEMDDYMENTKDFFYKKFGVKLAGWDVSGYTKVIKSEILEI